MEIARKARLVAVLRVAPPDCQLDCGVPDTSRLADNFLKDFQLWRVGEAMERVTGRPMTEPKGSLVSQASYAVLP